MGKHPTHTPAAPGVDTDDHQVPPRTHATGGFTQQAVGRQTEVQAMLQHHHIGGVLAQRPGLFFADDLNPGQRCAQTHVALHLRGLGRRFGTRTVVHQIAAEVAPQLFFEQALFFMQHQLPQGAGEPVAGQADQLQPLRIGLGKGLIGHCSLP
ncbi:hypothetical protein D3C80_1423610 [compost metagenome]